MSLNTISVFFFNFLIFALDDGLSIIRFIIFSLGNVALESVLLLHLLLSTLNFQLHTLCFRNIMQGQLPQFYYSLHSFILRMTCIQSPTDCIDLLLI